MATATKQLEAIHQEISERFSQSSSISVSALEGDPPEKYEISYHITGAYRGHRAGHANPVTFADLDLNHPSRHFHGEIAVAHTQPVRHGKSLRRASSKGRPCDS